MSLRVDSPTTQKLPGSMSTLNLPKKEAPRAPETVGQLDRLGFQAEVIGRYGGANFYEKILVNRERVVELAKYVQKVKPNIGFAFVSLRNLS